MNWRQTGGGGARLSRHWRLTGEIERECVCVRVCVRRGWREREIRTEEEKEREEKKKKRSKKEKQIRKSE